MSAASTRGKTGETARQTKDELLDKADEKVAAGGEQPQGGSSTGQETGDMATSQQGTGAGQNV